LILPIFGGLVALALVGVAGAEAPTSFTAAGLGGGGAMFSPSFSPHDSNVMFVACDMSELFRSTDGASTWQPVSFREIRGNRWSAVRFTDVPNTLYVLDYAPRNLIDGQWPMRSTDGGVTWSDLPADPTGGEAYSLWADPDNSQRLLISDYSRLFFSSNGGTTWAQRHSTASGNGLHVGGVFWDGTTILVGTSVGLLESTDGGTSFSVSAKTGIAAGQAMISFAGAKQSGTTRLWALTATAGNVYAGYTVEDFFYSHQDVYAIDWSTGGSSWQMRNTGLPTGASDGLTFIGCARNNTSVAYVSGQRSNEDPMVYKTTNGGTGWSSVLTTTTNGNVQTGWAGHQGDRGWTYGAGTVGFSVASNDPNRIGFTDYGFLHISTDGGATWRAAYVPTSGLNPSGAATPKGKAYASNGIENTSAWWLHWSSTQNIFAGYTDIRGTRSTDGGATWSFNYTGHTENTAYHIVSHPNGRLYMATSTTHDIYQSTYLTDARLNGGDGRVITSNDSGATWTLLRDFNEPVIWLARDPNNNERLYASVIDSANGDIYRTGNLSAGASSTWTRLATPPRTEGHPFNIHVLNDGTLVSTYSGRRTAAGAFTASSGVFVSTNDGTSWVDRSHANMQWWTKDLVIWSGDAAQNTWFVGVFSGWGGAPNDRGGLYRTTDRGQNWTRLNTLHRVTSVAFDPIDPTEGLFTTEGDGLWSIVGATSASPTMIELTWYPFNQPERVFYNPFNQDEVWVTSFGNGLKRGTIQRVPVTLSGMLLY